MVALTERLPHAGGFIITDDDDGFSYEAVTLAQSRLVAAGTVLGRIDVGTSATATAGTNNHGNGTLGAITLGAGVVAGTYTLHVAKAATNGGDFQVTGPDGHLVGIGSVGSAFVGGGLSFTLADGATDFVVGDTITITVPAGSGKWVALDPAAINGAQIARGILVADRDATAADVDGSAVVRLAFVRAADLTWPAAITDTAKAQALADLARATVLAR